MYSVFAETSILMLFLVLNFFVFRSILAGAVSLLSAAFDPRLFSTFLLLIESFPLLLPSQLLLQSPLDLLFFLSACSPQLLLRATRAAGKQTLNLDNRSRQWLGTKWTNTVSPRYNAPRYNAISAITPSPMSPKTARMGVLEVRPIGFNRGTAL